MKTATPLLAAAFAVGCANSAFLVSSGTPAVAPAPHTTVTSGAAGASVTTTSTAAAAFFVLTLGAMEYANNPQPFPSPASLMLPTQPAPQLSPGRRISEQDCSKPVDITLGNLRCK